MENIIQQAAKAKQLIADKKESIEQIKNKLTVEYNKADNYYYKEIRKLTDEKDNKLSEIQGKVNEANVELKNFIEENYKPIELFNRILNIIGQIKTTKKKIRQDFSAIIPEGSTEVETLIADKYLTLKAFIIKNKKPINKFSLILIGESLFRDRKIIEYPFNYGINLKSFVYPSILTSLKDGYSEKELLNWWGKNKHKSFWNEQEHKEVIELYEWVLSNCNTPEWEYEYLLDRKYYYEHRVSHGVEMPEYKTILKALKKLKPVSK